MELATHYSAKELFNLALLGLPKSERRILEKAKRENWQSRKRTGRGGGLEYAFSSLPTEIQQEILLKTTPQQTAVELQKIEKNRPLASNELWQMWDEASHNAQEQAKIKLGVMFAVANLVESGVNVLTAFEAVCGKENVEREQNNQKKLTIGSLKNWWYLIKDTPRQDWLPLLLNNRGKGAKKVAAIDDEAWKFFKNLYYTREQPTIAHSYEILKATVSEFSQEVAEIQSGLRAIQADFQQGSSGADWSAWFPSAKRTLSEVSESVDFLASRVAEMTAWVVLRNDDEVNNDTERA